MDKDKIKVLIEKNNIRWIQIHFTDLLGKLRVLHIPSEGFLNDAFKDGISFDGSSVGFTNVEKSDLLVVPDKKTFIVLPHEEDEARLIANIYDTSGKPFLSDPRYILSRAIQKAKEQGYDEIKISPEIEFYILNKYERDYEIEEKKGYFIAPPFDIAKNYRRELAEALMKSGYSIKYHHHETGRYQQEIEIKTVNAIEAADFCIYLKYLAREVATFYNLLVTFMPKPFSDDAGNGMHAHISFHVKGRNIFYDENDGYNLSQTARYFIGGIIEHARSLTAIANPTVNSYKRLIPDFEAPCYVAWGRYNRSGLIRIPAKKDIDIELRNADPTANPYLLYSAIIYAGIDGIKKKIEYEPIEKNLYKVDKERMKEYGVKELPSNLMEALAELENDDVIKRGIGKETIEIFAEEKRKEWKKYMCEVNNIDYEFYFDS